MSGNVQFLRENPTVLPLPAPQKAPPAIVAESMAGKLRVLRLSALKAIYDLDALGPGELSDAPDRHE